MSSRLTLPGWGGEAALGRRHLALVLITLPLVWVTTRSSSMAAAPSASGTAYQAPNLKWVPSLRSWNYDFFGPATDGAGRPVDTTDSPVNLVFVGGSLSRV